MVKLSTFEQAIYQAKVKKNLSTGECQRIDPCTTTHSGPSNDPLSFLDLQLALLACLAVLLGHQRLPLARTLDVFAHRDLILEQQRSDSLLQKLAIWEPVLEPAVPDSNLCTVLIELAQHLEFTCLSRNQRHFAQIVAKRLKKLLQVPGTSQVPLAPSAEPDADLGIRHGSLTVLPLK